MKMNNCYMCGSKMQIDFSACSEVHGFAFQDITIECENEKCFAQVILTADYSYVRNCCGDELIKFWDSLQK